MHLPLTTSVLLSTEAGHKHLWILLCGTPTHLSTALTVFCCPAHNWKGSGLRSRKKTELEIPHSSPLLTSPSVLKQDNPKHICQHSSPSANQALSPESCAQWVTLEHSAHLSAVCFTFLKTSFLLQNASQVFVWRDFKFILYRRIPDTLRSQQLRVSAYTHTPVLPRAQPLPKEDSTKEASCFFCSLPSWALNNTIYSLLSLSSLLTCLCLAENSKKGRGFFYASTNMLEEEDYIYTAVFVVVYLQHEVFHLDTICCHSSYNRFEAQHLAPSSATRGWKGSAPLCWGPREKVQTTEELVWISDKKALLTVLLSWRKYPLSSPDAPGSHFGVCALLPGNNVSCNTAHSMKSCPPSCRAATSMSTAHHMEAGPAGLSPQQIFSWVPIFNGVPLS